MPGNGYDLTSHQRAKERPEEEKPPEDTKRRGDTRAGEEEARRRGAGVQGLETRTSSGPAGTGPQFKAHRGGGWFEEMAEDG